MFSLDLCADYSPALQLRILGAKAEQLLDPILDLGCGPKGKLVRHLRKLGKEAFGVDREVSKNKFLISADWLDFPLRVQSFGTVISHMAFSNHFLHHHLHRKGHPERYAKRYMEVLRSLKQGGSFLYAPGLPFFEDLLPPHELLLEKHPIADLLGGEVDKALSEKYGTSVMYACRITKR
jgi:hypothetical protein